MLMHSIYTFHPTIFDIIMVVHLRCRSHRILRYTQANDFNPIICTELQSQSEGLLFYSFATRYAPAAYGKCKRLR